MKPLLRLFLLSVLLTSGYTLECETCSSEEANCTAVKVACLSGKDTCLSVVSEITDGSETKSSTSKLCISKDDCKDLKVGSPSAFGKPGYIVKSFECDKAPVSSGSFFLALSGLLFLKLLW